MSKFSRLQQLGSQGDQTHCMQEMTVVLSPRGARDTTAAQGSSHLRSSSIRSLGEGSPKSARVVHTPQHSVQPSLGDIATPGATPYVTPTGSTVSGGPPPQRFGTRWQETEEV